MDIRELDRRAIESTGSIIDGLDDAQLDAPTPCTEWTVRGVIQHMVENNHRTVDKLAGRPETPVAPGLDPRADYRESAAVFTAAFADGTALAVPYEMALGTFTGAVALGIHFTDVLVHGWDIGTAVGIDVLIEDDLAEAALAMVAMFPDSPNIWGPNGVFADRLPVADDAPAHERLLALTGRSAVWSAL
ncbi:TIGR03086 family metal-binding protein [Actinokineospora sp.]|uniref:TIGR03086 family metal-binding protein n=1 Tax=Actinokineospora sp. TaxID=1872133 RepID=UPI0040378A5C